VEAATSSGIEHRQPAARLTAPMLAAMAMRYHQQPGQTVAADGWRACRDRDRHATMPNRLPWRDEAGLDSPRSDRMNSTPATR